MLKKNRKIRIPCENLIIYLASLSVLLYWNVVQAADGSVSSGKSNDLASYRPLYSFSLPRGKESSDIVGIGIAGSNDHVYVWYRDGTVSAGTSDDLDRFRNPYKYSLPRGKEPYDIVGIGIAGSDDHVYVWYEN